MCWVKLKKTKRIEIGRRLLWVRKEKGLSQEEFAKALKVSRQTISSIENGKYNPSLDLAFDIAALFEKSIEEIFIYERSDDK